MKRIYTTVGVFIVVLGIALSLFGQSKAKKPTKKLTPKKTQTVIAEQATQPEKPVEIVEVFQPQTKTPTKKNERPESEETNVQNPTVQEPQKKNQSSRAGAQNGAAAKQNQNVFHYEFTQPNFTVSRVVIEHDENGKGTITFEKKSLGADPVTDPLQLSAASLEKIKNLFQSLNFLDSSDDYQSAKQFPHMGTIKVSMKKDGKERTSTYNWTDNKDAKALMDEYRKIGQQFIWMFDISISRENQPLESPSLMDQLDSLYKRDELSDPAQLLPFLKKLGDDERIPLIARNHATRLVKDIEKKSSSK